MSRILMAMIIVCIVYSTRLMRGFQINKALVGIDAGQAHAHFLADVEALFAAHDTASGRNRQQPGIRALRRNAGDNGIKDFPNLPGRA